MLKASLGDMLFWSSIGQLKDQRELIAWQKSARLLLSDPVVPWSLTEDDREFLKDNLITPE